MNLTHVVAIEPLTYGIGSDNKLLYHSPGDLAYFKERTMHRPVLVGRATALSLPPKGLPGREVFVLTSDISNPLPEWATPVPSLLELRSLFGDEQEIIVAGGQQVYAHTFPHTRRIELTVFNKLSGLTADRFYTPAHELPLPGNPMARVNHFGWAAYYSESYEDRTLTTWVR